MTVPPKSANRLSGGHVHPRAPDHHLYQRNQSIFPSSSFMAYYTSNLKSKQRSEHLCHERLKLMYEKPPVQRGPYLAPLLSGSKQSYVTVTCDMAQCFRSVFSQNCSGFPSEKLTKVRSIF